MTTYTSSLRFVKPADGALAWGNTVNNGFTELADTAIAGTTTVTLAGSNVTLTDNAGTADQARAMFLVLDGSPGATRDVIVPSRSKLYFVHNNTTGGFAQVVRTSGSGVTVPNGARMVLRCDGSNVVQAADTFISPTLTSPSLSDPALTGTPTAPTAASGTNTTQIATTAFVQAALQALHPVGSIYINATNATNPGTLLGFGTWVAFGAGRVPVGFNASNPLFDTAEETGGSADAITVSHTHTFSATTSTAGSHTHSMNFYANSGANTGAGGFTGAFANYTNMDAAGNHDHSVSGTTASTGSSGTNANYQPYITVYMWKRTA
jgi:hypothetical protein